AVDEPGERVVFVRAQARGLDGRVAREAQIRLTPASVIARSAFRSTTPRGVRGLVDTSFARRGQLELDDEPGPAVVQREARVMLLGDRLHERQPQAVARQRARAIEPREALEHPLALVRGNAR